MNQIAELTTASRLTDLSATLHMLILERQRAEAELNLLEVQRAGFRFEARIIDSRAEFLNQLQQFRYDVVISSHNLHGWTGLDALEILRQSGQAVPFIFVTESQGEEIAVHCFRCGATDYVLKDHRDQLPKVLRRALEAKAMQDARALMIQALHLSEASSHFLFSCNPVPMCVFDRRTLDFLEMNRAAIEHYGYERHEFLQMRLSDLHPPDEIPRLLSAIQGNSGEGQISGTWRHTRKDGSVVEVELAFHYMEYAGRPAAMAVAQNFTLRRALEEQSQQVRELEAIGRLSRGFAHDFNNAIGAIVGWAEIGEEQAEPIDSKLALYFKKIRGQCDRESALIGQLLTFTRGRITERLDLDLNHCVRDALIMLGDPAGVEIKTTLADNLATVRGDPTQFGHALVNLCSKLCDAMPGGGSLLIEGENVQISVEDCRRNHGLSSGSFVKLSLRGTENNTSPAVQKHDLERFAGAKAAAPDPRVMIAYGIIEQHGGFIHAESTPGRENAFRIFIPTIQRAGEAAAVSSSRQDNSAQPEAAANGSNLGSRAPT